MTGLKLWIYGVGISRSTNCATTIAIVKTMEIKAIFRKKL